jgi:short-subunit dehydrogenase
MPLKIRGPRSQGPHGSTDLTKDEEVKRLWDEILATGRPVDANALNAGIGTAGDFTKETELETGLRIIDLNVSSTVHLAKLAAKQMVRRRAGRILITASIAGTMPTPFMAVYGASKASCHIAAAC